MTDVQNKCIYNVSVLIIFLCSMGVSRVDAAPVSVERFVDAPYTMDQVKHLASEPHFNASIIKRKENAPVSHCAHSAACVIVLPFLLYKSLTLEEWYDVEVSKNTKPYLVGKYTLNGDLFHARLYQGDQFTDVRLVTLDALGRTLLIKEAEGTVKGNTVSTSSAVSLISQLNLLEEYRRILAGERNESKRVRLVSEALSWYGQDASALAMERLKDKTETVKVKEWLVTAACDKNNTGTGKVLSVKDVLDTANRENNIDIASAVLSCYRNHPFAETGDAGMALATLSTHYCTHKDDSIKLVSAVKQLVTTSPLQEIAQCLESCNNPKASLNSAAVKSAIDACALPARNARLKRVYGLSVTEDEFMRAVASSDKQDHVEKLIDEVSVMQYHKTFVKLATNKGEHALTALQRLASADKTVRNMSQAELMSLVEVYFRDDHEAKGILSLKYDSDFEKREQILRILYQARQSGVDVSAVIRIFEEALKGKPRIEKSSVEIGLVMLGKPAYLHPSISSAKLTHEQLAQSYRTTASSEGKLVTNVLHWRECDTVKMAEMLRTGRSTTDFAALRCVN